MTPTNEAMTGALALVGLISTIGGLVVYVVTALGLSRVFAKAGRPAWAAWVPAYNTFTLLRLGGRSGWWVIALFIPLVQIVGYVFLILAVHSVSRAFGRGAGSTVLGALLLPVWACVLGFGSAEWDPDAVGTPLWTSTATGADADVSRWTVEDAGSAGTSEGAPQVTGAAPVAVVPPVPPGVAGSRQVGSPPSAPADSAARPEPDAVAPDAAAPVGSAPMVDPPAPATPPPFWIPVAGLGAARERRADLRTAASSIEAAPLGSLPTPVDAPPSPAPVSPASPVAAPVIDLPSADASASAATRNPWAPPSAPVTAPPAAFVAPRTAPPASARGSDDEDDDADATVIASRRRPQWRLEFGAEESVAFEASVVIVGRRPASDPRYPAAQLVAVTDPLKTVSKVHARFEAVDEGWVVVDLDSTNGVYLVDDEGEETELTPRVPTPAGSWLVLGEFPVRLLRAE